MSPSAADKPRDFYWGLFFLLKRLNCIAIPKPSFIEVAFYIPNIRYYL